MQGLSSGGFIGGVAFIRKAIRKRFSSIDEFIEASQQVQAARAPGAAEAAADQQLRGPPGETDMFTLAAMCTIVMPGAGPALTLAEAAAAADGAEPAAAAAADGAKPAAAAAAADSAVTG
jgi:hypothetical protein